MNDKLFPPYGRMIKEWEDSIQGDGSPPDDWNSPIKWLEWRAKVIELLNIVLWPSYEPTTQEWIGASRASMLALTNVDFALFEDLRPLILNKISLPGGPVSHYDLFKIEDFSDVKDAAGNLLLDRSLDATLLTYLDTLADAPELKDLADNYIKGLGRKSGNVDLELKRFLQRPRAYQMAVLLKVTGFTHQHATSAVTPAMISGHCFEACMGGVAAYYRAREKGFSNSALDALAQHTVDCGDRRVFAGVHYASDNISSWIVGLLICPLVCPDLDGATWLWKAIKEKSAVYAALKTKLAEQPSGPYRPSLELLSFIGDNPGVAVDEALQEAQATPSS